MSKRKAKKRRIARRRLKAHERGDNRHDKSAQFRAKQHRQREER